MQLLCCDNTFLHICQNVSEQNTDEFREEEDRLIQLNC